MEFAMPAIANASSERQRANAYPTIRIFSVGHRTSSDTPLRDLQTVWEPWQVASNETIAEDFGPGHTLFSTFSAVCWIFGRELSDRLSPSGEVPIGLISSNWGGTTLEQWSPTSAFAPCNRTSPTPHGGPMWNGVIHPYAAGPMALAGFTFYQGEANTRDAASATQYSCLFPSVIRAWRMAFRAPRAFFGFVQLSTWCAQPPESIPLMRVAQMAAMSLPDVAYATNADHGMGCAIHPAAKQFVGTRLANAALAVRYDRADVRWRSPTYRTAAVLLPSVATPPNATAAAQTVARLAVSLYDVGPSGLITRYPFNHRPPGYGDSAPVVVDCTSTYPLNQTANASMAEQCAFAALHVSGVGWINASVAVDDSGQKLILSASLPPRRANATSVDERRLLGSAYGWGPIPMMSAYDAESELPVLPWNRSIHTK